MDIVDFTKKRLNSKPDGLPITVCPHCGRKGQHTKLRDNTEAWRHRVDGMFAVDACSLKPDDSWSETRYADAVEMVRAKRSKDQQWAVGKAMHPWASARVISNLAIALNS